MGIVLTATFFMKTGLAGGRLIFLTRALDFGVKSYGLNALVDNHRKYVHWASHPFCILVTSER